MKKFLAPIMLRFKETDALLETMEFLWQFEDKKLASDLREMVDRAEMQIARELIRRNVKFW